jgi:hypothetical protein
VNALGADLRGEIEDFRKMLDRRLRWQTRMIIGTGIACVIGSVTLSHLFA